MKNVSICSIILQGTNEILRLYVALTGIQYAGKELKELVKYVVIFETHHKKICLWDFKPGCKTMEDS